MIRNLRLRATDVVQEVAGGFKYRRGNRRGNPVWPRPIFVLGTGRSGTTWVGRILDDHPEVAGSIERPRFFDPSREMALDPPSRQQKLPRLVRLYHYEIARVAPRHFADKSHTNIWIAELLAQQFPDAVFVGVRRSVYGTVASMLRHRGVQRWAENWRKYPLPNRFLGIEVGEGEWYESLDPAARHALRWSSHERRFAELRPILGAQLVELRYEDLQLNPEETLRAVQDAAHLQQPFRAPAAKRESLDRWQNELSSEQIEQIDSIVTRELAPAAS